MYYVWDIPNDDGSVTFEINDPEDIVILTKLLKGHSVELNYKPYYRSMCENYIVEGYPSTIGRYGKIYRCIVYHITNLPPVSRVGSYYDFGRKVLLQH